MGNIFWKQEYGCASEALHVKILLIFSCFLLFNDSIFSLQTIPCLKQWITRKFSVFIVNTTGQRWYKPCHDRSIRISIWWQSMTISCSTHGMCKIPLHLYFYSAYDCLNYIRKFSLCFKCPPLLLIGTCDTLTIFGKSLKDTRNFSFLLFHEIIIKKKTTL